MARVDVLIPNYQYGRYLRQCVESVTSQGVDDIRILIIDNASTDDSVAIAHELMAEDSRIELIARTENQGAVASLNDGIAWASAEYFRILHADDMLTTGSFACTLPVLDANPSIAFAYGAEAQWFETDPLPQPQPQLDARGNTDWRGLSDAELILARSRPSRTEFGMGTMLVRTSEQKAVGGFRAELPYTCDLEMMLRLAKGRKALETSRDLGIRRLHGRATSATFQGQLKKELVEIECAFESFFAHEGVTLAGAQKLRRNVRRNLGERAYWAGVAHLVRGQTAGGRDLMSLAFRLSPRAALIPPLHYLRHIPDPLQRIRSRLAQVSLRNSQQA